MDTNGGFHNFREQILLELKRAIRALGGAASLDVSDPTKAYQRLEAPACRRRIIGNGWVMERHAGKTKRFCGY